MTGRRNRPRRPRASRRAPARPRDGITLVEVLIAVMLISVGVLAVASSSLSTSRLIRASSRDTRAAMIVQSRLDSLASIHCRLLVANNGVVSRTTSHDDGRIVERWTIRDLDNQVQILDTVTIAGRSNALAYESMMPCRN